MAKPLRRKPAASKAVFINCPFDDRFKPILRAMVFTIIASGYHPRCALDATDGAEIRVGKIATMIGECDWGIHDLSRVEVDAGGVPRFNMPMELGFISARGCSAKAVTAASGRFILDAQPHRYDAALSDISGQDIESHNNDPDQAIQCVRNWLSDHRPRNAPPLPGAAALQADYGLKHYGGLLDDDRHRAILLLHAHDGLVAATADDAIYDSIEQEPLSAQFALEAESYAAAGDLDRIRALQDLDVPPLGRSKAERTYRSWCLDRRLFLNPLNDLGSHARGAFDDLALPPIGERFDERPGVFTPPPVIGFFNQMKQEYVSARFMLYEGLQDTKVHFSDRGVQLFDTLDYPAHSLATERVRAAFRIAYSLLDKAAFLVDHYWKLGKIADRINFKNVWMVEGKARLLERFKEHPNWPLRGLFWLSKELFDDELKRTTAPDAQELHDIRNALEHKYLQVHEGWAWSIMRTPPSSEGLGLSVDSDLLEAKALRVMKIARSALIQLALAIGVEERARDRERPTTIVGSIPLFGLDDRRKRRDPM